MKTLVAIPCHEMVQAMFCKSLLGMRPVGETEYTFVMGSLIYDARNKIAEKAIKEGFDRTIWFDSDMVFQPDTIERIQARMDDGLNLVSGLYFSRKPPYNPVVYKELAMVEVSNGKIPDAVPYDDYPQEPFEIAACGFGCCGVTVDLLKKVRDKFGLPFSPIMGFGEDLSFCLRLADLGIKMFCDPTIKAEHIGYCAISEEHFFWEKAQRLGEKNE